MNEAPEIPRLRLAVVPVTPLEQNCAILFDEETKHGAVSDPGGDVAAIRRAIDELGIVVDRILLTHGHFDHAGGAADLKAVLEKDYGRPVPIEGPHREDAFLLERIPESGARWGVPGLKPVTPDRWLDDGDTVEVGGIVFEVIHCPGHSPGSVVYLQREVGFAVVGDVLFAGSIGRTDLPRGNLEDLLASIRDKLLPVGDDVGFLPGHGPTSTFGAERTNNPFLTLD